MKTYLVPRDILALHFSRSLEVHSLTPGIRQYFRGSFVIVLKFTRAPQIEDEGHLFIVVSLSPIVHEQLGVFSSALFSRYKAPLHAEDARCPDYMINQGRTNTLFFYHFS